MAMSYTSKGLAKLAIRYPFTLDGFHSVLNLTYAALATLLVLSAIPAIVIFSPAAIPILAAIGAFSGIGVAALTAIKGLNSNRSTLALAGALLGVIIGILVISALATAFPIPVFAIALASIPVIGVGLGATLALKKAMNYITGRIADFLTRKGSTNDPDWEYSSDDEDYNPNNEERLDKGEAPIHYSSHTKRPKQKQEVSDNDSDWEYSQHEDYNPINEELDTGIAPIHYSSFLFHTKMPKQKQEESEVHGKGVGYSGTYKK